ncbi:MAG: hypothetical protein NZ480_08395 [Bdellovibrionaceae bacterium]|nr:hypothetical protein [Pseudobdellovibrionaceae bacterium]
MISHFFPHHNGNSSKFNQKAQEGWNLLQNQTESAFHHCLKWQSLWEKSQTIGYQINEKWPQIVWIGIGGSSLGTQIIKDLYDVDNRLFILDNPDPRLWEHCINWVQDWRNVHIVVASKSGSTLETLVLFHQILSFLSEKHISIQKNQVTVISDKKPSDLLHLASHNGWTHLEIPEKVGGRYSIFSPIGLLPFSLFKVNLNLVKEGIQQALDDQKRICELVTLSLESIACHHQLIHFFCYSSSLRYYGLWMQQLWAESLGKKGSYAPFPVALVGANDQHSVLQYLVDGAASSWSHIIYVRSPSNRSYPVIGQTPFPSLNWAHQLTLNQVLPLEAHATYQSLIQNNRSSTLWEVEDLGPQSVSHLLMTSMLWVATLGLALQINPFDQPGVELGKKIIKTLVKV